jgi:tetratricopeptide (TPR) repeat protein
MNRQKNLFFSSLLIITLISSQCVFAQSSDDLFKQARSAAFDKKDYTEATQLSKQALTISPDYSDIQIFLGRVYTWWGKTDSARNCFQKVLDHHPENEDACAAFTDLEYWNNNSLTALSVCEKGLAFHPESKTLLMKKAKCLIDLKRFEEASNVLSGLLKNDPKNTEARSALGNLKEQSSKNKIGFSYDFVTFDKQFDNPWHLVSVDYTRSTKAGSITTRVNYANRFKTNGVQFETDAYP